MSTDPFINPNIIWDNRHIGERPNTKPTEPGWHIALAISLAVFTVLFLECLRQVFS